jgi:hypothetical protein
MKTDEKASTEEQYLKKRSVEMGCCENSQSLLMINHIYCDTIALQNVNILGGKNE